MSLEPDAPAPVIPSAHRQSMKELLQRYGLEQAGEPSPVPESVLNQNYRVETNGGPRFMRFHRKTRARERLELEHDVSAWAGDRGIPTVRAIDDGSGRWLHSLTNQFVTIYRWLEGTHFRRGAINPAQAAVLGEMHGRLHATLREFEDPRLSREMAGTAWDRDEALEMLGRIDDLIRYYPAASAEQLALQEGVRYQMELLDSPAARPVADFAHLKRQCCHGDYHERNVMIGADGGVLAVLDWEIVSLLPPIFEVMRALSFMELWEPELSGAYLGAYRKHATLADCEAGVELWWQAQLHSTWALKARFIEGNRAAGQFIQPHVRMLRQLAEPAFRASLLKQLLTNA